jgi:4-hydroxy-tetrahydrodipicolinate synthase
MKMFEGAYTAIVTPFNAEGEVDLDTFRKLIERQAEGGIDGIVPVGTTGESPTLDVDEHGQVIEKAVEFAAGRMKVIAGTGANSTAEAVQLTIHAKEAGADGTLQVTPYYNKPSQEGLYRHFSTVADIGLPVVLYNVPGRSSREIEVSTVARLSEHPNVACLKEAGGSVDRVSAVADACDIEILSGDDGLTLPMMAVGAKGVISVASNIIPAEVTQMVHAALEGDMAGARELHGKYYGLFCDLFIDTNPIPVKAAMAMLGLIEERYRLPLCEMSDSARETLKATMSSVGLL